MTSLLTTAYAKIRNNALPFATFAAGVAVNQGINFLGYAGMYQSSSDQHVITGDKSAFQSELLENGMATGNWTLVSMANEMAIKMVNHCEKNASHDYSAAVALYVIGAIVLAGGAYATYRVSQNAPEPGYTTIDASPN